MKFRKMRKSNKETSLIETQEILSNGEYGVLSVKGDEGYPYGVPVNYIYKNDCIYIHCAGEGYKLDAIIKNSKVSFCVVLISEIVQKKFTSKFKSAIAFGNAVVIEGAEKIMALKELIRKYSPEYISEGDKYIDKNAAGTTIIKIVLEHKTGKSNY